MSFNNVTGRQAPGPGPRRCLKANGEYGKHRSIAELNGSPTDNNATLFEQGYNSVLNPLYKNGTLKKGPDQSVPDWDNQKALTIFERMLARRPATRSTACSRPTTASRNAVVSALKAHKLKPIPVTGQDATPQGIQNILAG